MARNDSSTTAHLIEPISWASLGRKTTRFGALQCVSVRECERGALNEVGEIAEFVQNPETCALHFESCVFNRSLPPLPKIRAATARPTAWRLQRYLHVGPSCLNLNTNSPRLAQNKIMKAVVVEEFGQVTVKEIPDPVISDYDVLCETLYGAICSGTDRHIVEGTFPWTQPLPTIIGHESIGSAIKCGAKGRYIETGDLVTRVGSPAVGAYSSTWGGLSELSVATDYRAARDDDIPEENWQSKQRNQVLPEGCDPAEATMFITWRETLSYANRIGIKEGRSLLVIGSGGNGLAFIAHASNATATHRVMIGSPSRETAARRAGVSHYFDYHAADLAEQIRAEQPDGFDVVIDSLGRKDGADFALSFVKENGILGVYGCDDYEDYRIAPRKINNTIKLYSGFYDEAEAHNQVLQYYQDGELDAGIWLDPSKAFRLSEAREALAAANSGEQVKPLIRIRN